MAADDDICMALLARVRCRCLSPEITRAFHPNSKVWLFSHMFAMHSPDCRFNNHKYESGTEGIQAHVSCVNLRMHV
jgi:hypothetical protein